MAQGSLYTLKAQLQDNLSGPLNNVTNNIKNSAKQSEKASKDLKQFQNSINSCTGSLGQLATALKTGDFSSFASGALNAGTAIKNLGPIITGLKASLGGLLAEVTACTGGLNLLIGGIVAVGAGAVKSNVDLQKSQQSLQSLLGVSDQVVDEYTQSAIEMSRGTTKAAGDVLDAFTLIGSQAPQLLDDKEGLEGVTQAALTLSAAAKMDVVDAAKAITTAMNQLGLSADESTNIIDAMSTAAQKGSADIQYQVEALNKSGAAARMAKVSFTELIATIEGIATSFPSAEVAGSRLNAMFVRLEAQTNNNFKPSVVGLKPALDNLANANLSAADKVKLFGQGNIVCAEALMRNRDAIATMNQQLQQHGTALEMAQTNSDTLATKWEKLKNAFGTLFEELGQSAVIKALVDALEMLVVVLTKTIQVIGKILHPFLEFFNWINKIGNALIQKLIPYIQDAVKNGLDYFRKGWANLINAVGNNALVRNITKIFNKAVDIVLKAIAKIKSLWNDFLKWLGLSSTKIETPKVKFETVQETNTETVTTTPTGGGKTKGGKGSKTTKTSVKVEAKEGSLAWLEKKLSDLQNQYKNGLIKITPDDYKQQVEDLERQILAKKIELGIEIDVKGALKQLSIVLGKEHEIEAKIKADDPKNLIKQLDTLTKSIHDIKVKINAEDPDELTKELKEIDTQIHTAKVEIRKEDPNGILQEISDIKDQESTLTVTLQEKDPDNLFRTLNDIQKEIKDLEAEKAEIEIKVKSDTDAIDATQRALNGLEDVSTNLTVEVNTELPEAEISRLKEITAQIESLKDKETEIRVEIDTEFDEEAFKEIQDIQTKIDELHDKEADLKVKLQTEFDESRLAKIKEIQDQIDKLENKKAEIKVELEAKVDKTKLSELSEIDKQIESLENKKKEIDVQINAAAVVKTDIDKANAEIDGQINALQDKKKELTVDVEADVNIPDLSDQLAEIDGQINALQDKKKSITIDIDPDVNIPDLTDQLSEIDTQLSELEDKKKTIKVQIEAQYDKDKLTEIQAIDEQINALQDQKKELEVQVDVDIDDTKLQKIKDIESKIQGLESRKEEIIVKITPEVDKEKQQEILNLNEQINSLKDKRVQIETEVNTTITEDAQFKIAELMAELKKLEDEKHQIEIGLGFDTKEVDNSLKGIQSRLSAYKDKLSIVDPNDTVLIEYINQQIKELTKQEKEIKIKVGLETKPAEGSLKDIQNKLAEANTKLQLTDPNDLALISELRKQIDDLTKQEKEIKFTLGIDKKPAEGSLKDIQEKLSKKQAELSATIVGTPEYYALIKEINDLEKQEHKIKIQMELDSLTEYEKKMKDIEKSQNVWNSVGSTVRSFGDAMNAIGNATDDQTQKVLAGFASIAQAIAELIPQIMALIAAKEGQALAEGTASAAGIGFPQNIAAIAAVVASIIGVIATIASITKGYASGGIVNGSSTVGDHMIARLNAGEMVLNNRQQQRLWNIINGNGSYRNDPGTMTVGQVRIKGSDLYLALKNYSKHQSKIGKDTGIK